MRLERALTSMFFVAITAAASGCFPPPLFPDSRIMQGEKVEVGNEKYDEFFGRVIDLKSRAQEADGKESPRKILSEAVGASETTPADEVIVATKTKASDLKTKGARYFMAISPAVKLYGEGKAKEFEKAVESAATQGLKRSEELRGMANEVRELLGKIDGLKNEVATDFAEPPKRDEVMRELEASKLVLETAELKAKSESGEALSFVIALAGAVDTGGAEAAAASEVAATPKPGRPTGRPTGAAQPPPTGRPKPRPKPTEDFDP